MENKLIVGESWKNGHKGASAGLLGLTLSQSPEKWPALDRATEKVENDLIESFTDRAAIKAHPVIQAYTAYYKRFKKTYPVLQQVETVAVKGKRIPRFTPLVQAMFTAELKNLILTAGHDRRAIEGAIRLESATGKEAFTGMGGKPFQIKAGDMFMTDDQGIISDVIYGPDQRTKIGKGTTHVVFAAFAPAGVHPDLVQLHLNDIASFCALIDPEAATGFLEVHTA